MNERMMLVLGIAKDEVLGVPIDVFLDEHDARALDARIATCKRGASSLHNQKFRGRDGTTGWLAMDVTPIHAANGELERVLAIALDITDRQQLEIQFRQAQKMEAIGRLASGVAHDFNNALSIILAYADDLLRVLAPGEPAREDVEEIKSAAVRSTALARQLLAFSRHEVLEPRVLNVNHVIGGVAKMLRRVIGEDIQIVLTLATDIGAIRANPGAIEQVLMNLVVNARDAMPRGGRLTIETANVLVNGARHVIIVVSDTGVGMDAATRAHVFEPFFTTKQHGTGLGLATVYGIVKQSGGGISLESAVGSGTRFAIHLPRVECVDDGPDVDENVAATAVPDGHETVLVVEDDPALRKAVCGLLERHGYRVLSASAPDDALRLSKHVRVDVLVSDVVMPRMSGPELAAKLTRSQPDISVICMSGYTDESVARHGLDRHVAFLQKPITESALVSKVRNVLDARVGLHLSDERP